MDTTDPDPADQHRNEYPTFVSPDLEIDMQSVGSVGTGVQQPGRRREPVPHPRPLDTARPARGPKVTLIDRLLDAPTGAR
jgi:hypothetical protein